MFENIKAVAFDFDDTLGNRSEYAYFLFDQYLRDCFPDIDNDILKREAILQDMLNFDQHSYVQKQYIIDRVAQKYHLTFPETNFTDYFNDNIYKYAVLFDGAEDVLKTLKQKYPLGIVTNGTSVSQRKKLEAVLDLSMFDSIIISGDYPGYSKPDPYLFNLLAQQLQVEKENILFVGDSFCNDVMGAIHAGLQALWIWPEDGRIQRTDIPRIHTINELLKIL